MFSMSMGPNEAQETSNHLGNLESGMKPRVSSKYDEKEHGLALCLFECCHFSYILDCTAFMKGRCQRNIS